VEDEREDENEVNVKVPEWGLNIDVEVLEVVAVGSNVLGEVDAPEESLDAVEKGMNGLEEREGAVVPMVDTEVIVAVKVESPEEIVVRTMVSTEVITRAVVDVETGVEEDETAGQLVRFFPVSLAKSPSINPLKYV
jgi:hypothetical protein